MYFDSKAIYKRIEKIRLDRGWSTYRLAKMASVAETSIYSWKKRGSLPTLYIIESIADAFGISPISLLLNDDELSAISQEHKELFVRWDSLTSEQKSSLMSMLRSFTREID